LPNLLEGTDAPRSTIHCASSNRRGRGTLPTRVSFSVFADRERTARHIR
jgi:hypothetical protein